MSEFVDESVAGRPSAALRSLVARYDGYRQAAVGPAVHRGVPSPFMTVIFTLDEPLVVAEHPDPAQPGGRYRTLTGGLHTAPALITHDGWQSGIQLALSPLAARVVLGMPAAELASLDVEGADVLGPVAWQVQQRLQETTGWAERFAMLDDLLLELAARCRSEVSPEVSHVWRRLIATGGNEPVGALATETGWSDRHLRARFTAEIGLSPKSAARVVRFDRARRLLQRRAGAGGPLDLAGLAAHCGYYDQAHLDRDFRSLAGCPPTTWLAQEFRYFQVEEALPVAG